MAANCDCAELILTLSHKALGGLINEFDILSKQTLLGVGGGTYNALMHAP